MVCLCPHKLCGLGLLSGRVSTDSDHPGFVCFSLPEFMNCKTFWEDTIVVVNIKFGLFLWPSAQQVSFVLVGGEALRNRTQAPSPKAPQVVDQTVTSGTNGLRMPYCDKAHRTPCDAGRKGGEPLGSAPKNEVNPP